MTLLKPGTKILLEFEVLNSTLSVAHKEAIRAQFTGKDDAVGTRQILVYREDVKQITFEPEEPLAVGSKAYYMGYGAYSGEILMIDGNDVFFKMNGSKCVIKLDTLERVARR